MDLQKEGELFLAHMRSIGSAGFMFELDEDGNFDDMSMAYAWSAWQAKAQAVPEGFVLMPKEPTDEIIEAMNEFDYRNDYSDMDGAYRTIVETLEKAQEDANLLAEKIEKLTGANA